MTEIEKSIRRTTEVIKPIRRSLGIIESKLLKAESPFVDVSAYGIEVTDRVKERSRTRYSFNKGPVNSNSKSQAFHAVR